MGEATYKILNMNGKIILLVVGLCGVALGGYAVSHYVLPPSVTAVSPRQGEAVEAVYATGTVEPTVMIPIAPKTTSRLTSIEFDEGQSVKKGDILARFEDDDLAAVIDQLRAQEDQTRKELERKNKLFEKKFISEDAYDQVKANLDVITASIREAQAKQDYLQLRSPEEATIIKRDGEIGQVIAAGTPVFYLSCCAPLRISAEVDEEDIVHVKAGQKVLIQSDAFPDQTFEGEVISITPKGDPVSRSYRVRISMKEGTPLLIGMTTETNIIYHQVENATLIPVEAIAADGKTVHKIDAQNKIEQITVKVGIRDVKTAEILDGLSLEHKIISPFDADLKNGHQVRVKEQ